MSARDRHGRYLPGHTPTGGRPKGFAGVSKLIMDSTRDGAELVEFALAVLRDTGSELRDRMAALNWLADRGLGKPLQSLELHARATEAPATNWSAVPIEQRRALLAAYKDARRVADAAGPGITDDNHTPETDDEA